MYQVEPHVIQYDSEQHASKTTPQYGFHKGIKEFADEGHVATKQDLYENLLMMDVVTMIKPCKLKKRIVYQHTNLPDVSKKEPEK